MGAFIKLCFVVVSLSSLHHRKNKYQPQILPVHGTYRANAF
jgi:hypothetical protein